jgi:hypothetical protein
MLFRARADLMFYANTEALGLVGEKMLFFFIKEGLFLFNLCEFFIKGFYYSSKVYMGAFGVHIL